MPKDASPPAFLFYPDDFSSDGAVEAMTTEEVGAYLLLLCKAWRESPPGSIPDDDRILARWTRLGPDRWAECRLSVLAAFKLGTDGRWHQKRMRREYDKFVKSAAERTKKAEKAAKSRWEHARSMPGACSEHSSSNANASSKQCLSSSSSISKPKNQTPSESGDVPPPARPSRKIPDSPHHRAIAVFCDAWKLKYGSKYPFVAGKDGEAFKAMLAHVDNDESRFAAVVSRYFEDDDPFIVGNRHDVGTLRSKFARFLVGAQPGSPRLRQQTFQPRPGSAEYVMGQIAEAEDAP